MVINNVRNCAWGCLLRVAIRYAHFWHLNDAHFLSHGQYLTYHNHPIIWQMHQWKQVLYCYPYILEKLLVIYVCLPHVVDAWGLQKKAWRSQEQRYKWLLATLWVQRYPEEQQLFWTAELSLRPHNRKSSVLYWHKWLCNIISLQICNGNRLSGTTHIYLPTHFLCHVETDFCVYTVVLR